MPDLTMYQMKAESVPGFREACMRALIAAATGLAVALALVLALTAMGSPAGETSPKPLLTTVPAHP
ncbi:hypothetical protein GCM10022295_44790 [Streptomyces osmaniensis]